MKGTVQKCFLCGKTIKTLPEMGYWVYSQALGFALMRTVCDECEGALGDKVFQMVADRQHFWDVRSGGGDIA